MRLFKARGSAELREVASGSATQGLWLRNGKVRSQVSGKDRSRLPGRGTVGEVRRGGRQERTASDTTKGRVHRFGVIFGRERRASRLLCLRLSLGDDRRSSSGSRFKPMIFITFVSCSEILTSFTKIWPHLAEGNRKSGRIQCQRSKESSSSRGKRKRRVFLCRRTLKIKVIGKVIPSSFLKIEGRGRFVGAKDRRKNDG